MKESEIQRQIWDYLAARQVLAFRMNTGAMKTDNRFLRFGVVGMADLLAFKESAYPAHGSGIMLLITPVWLEVKNAKGVQSEYQKSFQKQVESHGHLYVLARSVDDVVEVI